MTYHTKKITVVIPVLNAGSNALLITDALKHQTLQPDEILVIDSASTDDSVHLFEEIGAKIISIRREDFDHGGTRNVAFEKSKADVYIFMTQDAIPVDVNAFENLVRALFDNPNCGLVYGRQMPVSTAGAFARHARLFNYPAGDQTVVNTLFAEDSIAAAKLLQRSWSIGYVPQAVVTHSHDYSLKQDFCRYFDVGAFHSMNRWYIDFLGKAAGEGKRFVRSEYNYLKQEGVTLPLFRVILRNGVRWLGYNVGRLHNHLPSGLCRRISPNKAFWKRMNI